MTSTTRLRRRTLTAIAACAVALTFLAQALGAFGGLERSSLDARFEVRGAQPSSGVAVVAIDEQTFSSLRTTWPMRRSLHADMIDRLRRAGVRTIVYDVQFTEPSARPDDDLALLDAVERTPGTILATGESDANGRTRVLGGDEQLAEIGARAASSTFPSDAGGVIRRYDAENTKLITIAAAVAKQRGVTLDPSAFTGEGALIDFRGPTGTIPTYSFADVLAGKVPAERLRGQTVVVGASAPVLQDIHPTSAPGARLMPGPEIQANAIWTALRGNPLRDAPSWTSPVLTLLLAAAALLWVLVLGPRRAAVAVVITAAGFVGIAIAAFAGGIVLPVVAPLVGLVAVFVSTAACVAAAEAALRLQLTRYSEQLEREVKARTAELVDSQLEIVLRLARAAELRDDDTGEHIDRMSSLCGEVARELGFSDEDAERLRHASALHDIGKIGVPDGILLKPGRLTAEEFDVMRRHVVNGAELLTGSASPVLQLAEEVARTHHERWDGTGYPAGTAGEAIPLSGRIAAVCDVFDALTHERPYKRAWTVAEACAEVADQRGRHFDPAVADALLAVVRREQTVLELDDHDQSLAA